MLVSREFAVGPNMNHLGQEFSSGKNSIMFPTNYKMILYSWNKNIFIYITIHKKLHTRYIINIINLIHQSIFRGSCHLYLTIITRTVHVMSAMSGNNLIIMKWPVIHLILCNFVSFTYLVKKAY